MSKNSFPEALIQWRKKKGLTQQEVGDRIGLSRTIISFLESGKQVPQIYHLDLFKDRFGIDFSEALMVNEDKTTYEKPQKSSESMIALAELVNASREAKKDILLAKDLVQEMMEEDLKENQIKKAKVVFQCLESASRKL